MGINDSVNYVLFNNPVSSGMWSIASQGAKAVGLKPKAIAQTASTHTTSTAIQQVMPPVWKLLGKNRHILKLAGLSGASAVMLGAYFAHAKHNFADTDEEDGRDPKQIFEMTNRYHFIHSLALLAAPLARQPLVTTLMLASGMTLFCGSCYYIAFTNDRSVGKYTPVGGFLLIAGWLSFIL